MPPERQSTPTLRDGENGSVMCTRDINEGNTVEREYNGTIVFRANELGYRHQMRAVRLQISIPFISGIILSENSVVINPSEMYEASNFFDLPIRPRTARVCRRREITY